MCVASLAWVCLVVSLLTKIKPGYPARVGTVFGSIAMPFAEPAQFEFDYGATLAEIIEQLFTEGMVDDGWRDWLQVYIDDAEIAPKLWRVVRPRPGRLVAIRARPGWDFVIQAGIQLAIAIAASVLVQAFVGAPPEPITIDPVQDIDSSRNEIARYRKVPVGLGRWRMFPPHAAKAYTIGDGEKIKLRMLFCWGVAPYAIDAATIKLGDTPIANFTGVTVQHRLKQGDAWPSIFPSSADEQEGPGLMEFADGWVQRTTDADDANELQVEVLFPEGLFFRSKDGDIKSFGVTLRIRYRAEGSSTWLDFDTGASAAEGHLYTLSGYKALKPFRVTYKRVVTPGTKFEVAVKRAQADDPGPKGFNKFHWSKLRTFTYGPPVLDENLAVTAVEIEAGDQINGVVDLFNAEITRLAPKWDEAEEEWTATLGETRNPAELVRWLATGPGNPKPRNPATEIANASLGAWAELCTLRGWKCDYELRAGGGLDELMEIVARCGRGSLVDRNGKLDVVVDDLQAAPSQMFTARNSWGFRSQRRYPATTHALRCRFNNAAKGYQPDEMLVFYPGYTEETAELIRTVDLIGKITEEEVYASARRIIAEELVRPEDYSWRCDWENLVCQRGQRIAISHFVIAVGRKSARVKSRTVTGGTHVTHLVLDEKITQTPGDTYGLKWRKRDGATLTVEAVALTNMGNGVSNTVQLASSTPLASAPQIGDLVTFGDASIETLDVVIQNINRANDFEAEIMALPYAETLFDGDSEEMPEWSSNVAADAFPRPPAPSIGSVHSTVEGIYIAFDFPIALADRVDAVEQWWKLDIDDNAEFEYLATLPRSSRVATFPPGEGGKQYAIKLVSVGRAGDRTMRNASDVIEVTGGGLGGVLAGWLTNEAHTVNTNTDGSGGVYTSAGGSFKLFRGDIDISDGTDPDDVATTYEVVSATSGLSISINAATGVYTITNLTVDSAIATLRASNGGFSIERQYSITKAKNGVNAQNIRLQASAQQFMFNAENEANPASQSITLTALRQNAASGTVSWSSSPSVTLTGSGDSRSLAVADFGANTAVEITATLGSLTDKITIVRTRAGGNLFTTVRSSNVTLAGRSLKKLTGTAAWNAQAYSIESFVGGCFASAKPAQVNSNVMFALNTDPALDASYTSLDYAWYLRDDGNCEIYESSVKVWPESGTEAYAAGDVFSIAYDGSAIGYYRNGVLKRSIESPATNLRLYFDSSFYGVGAQLDDIAFGPAGGTASRQVVLYRRSIAPPLTPTGNNPAGWFLSPPVGSGALWSTTARQTAAGVLASLWSKPTLLTSPNWRGEYNGQNTYYAEDAVTYAGGSYRCRVASVERYLALDASATDPILLSPSGLAIAGTTYRIVRVRARAGASGVFEGVLYYATGGHGMSSSYRKQITAPANFAEGEWVEMEFDMAALTAGGTDWISNTITQLRLDFLSNNADSDVDAIELLDAAGNVGQAWYFTAGVEGFTATNGSVSHVGGKAPSGTADANAWWDVIAAPGAPGEPGTPPSSFTATIDLSSSTTGVNLRSVADAAGYTGLSDATITFEVESGVTITGLPGAPDGGIAIDTGTWPTTQYAIALTLTIKNGGKVYGGGGKAGNGAADSATGQTGGKGGDALFVRAPLTVNVNAGGELRAGGGGGGGGSGYYQDDNTGGGGGGGGCVHADAIMADGRTARELRVGDWIEAIDYDALPMLKLKQVQITHIDIVPAPCVLLITESGVQLTCSAPTPITQPDGSDKIAARDAHGCLAAVRDENGLRWEYIVTAEDAGVMEIARISAGAATYAGGNVAGRMIYTHNRKPYDTLPD